MVPRSASHGLQSAPQLVRRVRDVLSVRPDLRSHHTPTQRLFSQIGEPVDAPPAFFLFIQDYGWSLRYRATWSAQSDIDPERPLQIDWVKLRRSVHDPERLLEATSEETFNWDVISPLQHQGFQYRVVRTSSLGVEAAVNFLEGQGVSLILNQAEGIRLMDASGRIGGEAGAHAVTHCWVQARKLPAPKVQSISFYDAHEVVVQLKA